MAKEEHHRLPSVELRRVDKSFYGVLANEQVDFTLHKGEVHALLGENGAGKSTMCSILAGLYRPDSGEVLLDGKPVVLRSPKDALNAGIGMVYQHFRLITNLTVAENLALGHPHLGIRLSQKELERQAHELGERYEFPVDPSAYIWQLSVGMSSSDRCSQWGQVMVLGFSNCSACDDVNSSPRVWRSRFRRFRHRRWPASAVASGSAPTT